MTDREALDQLLTRLNLRPVIDPDPRGKRGRPVDVVVLRAGEGDVKGYALFEAVFAFSKDGTFIDLTLWE